MTRRIGWGFIGAGEIAVQLARALRRVPGAELTAVASRTLARAEPFAAAFGAQTRASYRQLVEDPRVEVVYIATPAGVHAEHALLAIEAGKAVVVEKPFAMSAAEALRVVDAARERRVFCMEAMWMSFIPAMVRGMEMLKDGVIGEVRMLTADFSVPTLRESGQRLFEPGGGGALLDRGVYPLHLACNLFGAPLEVASFTNPAREVDEHTAILLGFAGGRLAALTTALTSYGSNGASIMGSTGRLTFGEPLCRPDMLTLTPITPAGVVKGVPGPAGLKDRLRHHPLARRMRDMLRPRSRTIRVPYDGNGYDHEVAEVMRCVGQGLHESPVMPLERTLTVMRVLDAVRQRWRTVGSSQA